MECSRQSSSRKAESYWPEESVRGCSVGLPEWLEIDWGEKSDPRKGRTMGGPTSVYKFPFNPGWPLDLEKARFPRISREETAGEFKEISAAALERCRDSWGPARWRDLENTLGFTLKPHKEHILGLKDSLWVNLLWCDQGYPRDVLRKGITQSYLVKSSLCLLFGDWM